MIGRVCPGMWVRTLIDRLWENHYGSMEFNGELIVDVDHDVFLVIAVIPIEGHDRDQALLMNATTMGWLETGYLVPVK